MKKIMHFIKKTVEVICFFMLATMVILVFLQVFFRYVLVNPLGWSEEIGRITLVWTTFLGAYLVFEEKKHMRISILFNKLKKGPQRFLLAAGNILMIFLNFYIIKYGILFAYAFMEMYSPYLGFPMFYAYIIIPAAAFLWMLYLSLDTVQIIKDKNYQFKKEG